MSTFTSGQTLTAAQLNAIFDPLSNAWTGYAPTFANITVGNGTVTAAYMQIGKTVAIRFHLLFGSTTAIASIAQFSIPATAKGAVDQAIAGACNTSTQIAVVSGRIVAGTAICQLAAATSAVSATVPFTWAAGNSIAVSGIYEAA